jgi:cAMP phosphodiesterase
MNKEQIIDRVLKHIKIDVECGDLTAIEELLNHIPTEYLVGYLPEGTL